jgi:AcrR family transcriptional regulator
VRFVARSKKAPRAPYHHGNLREALLASVGAIIRKQGVGFVSLREVARHARVSHSAPAHHFANKAGLLTAFATSGYETLAGCVMAAIQAADATDPADVLEAVGRGYVRFALEHQEKFGIMFRLELLDATDPDFMRASDAAFALLSSTVELCAARGYVAEEDREIVAVSAWSLVHGLASLLISGRLVDRIRETDPDRLAARVSKAFVDAMLRARRVRA